MENEAPQLPELVPLVRDCVYDEWAANRVVQARLERDAEPEKK